MLRILQQTHTTRAYVPLTTSSGTRRRDQIGWMRVRKRILLWSVRWSRRSPRPHRCRRRQPQFAWTLWSVSRRRLQKCYPRPLWIQLGNPMLQLRLLGGWHAGPQSGVRIASSIPMVSVSGHWRTSSSTKPPLRAPYPLISMQSRSVKVRAVLCVARSFPRLRPRVQSRACLTQVTVHRRKRSISHGLQSILMSYPWSTTSQRVIASTS